MVAIALLVVHLFGTVWAILASLQGNLAKCGLHFVCSSLIALRYDNFGPIYRI